jgi:hypothetical protein
MGILQETFGKGFSLPKIDIPGGTSLLASA